MTLQTGSTTWQDVCHISDLQQDGGVAVRAHGQQVALFHTDQGYYALDNRDPFSGAQILARGIVGDLNGKAVVASPMYKQHFCLATGLCLENDQVAVRNWPVRLRNDGRLLIGAMAIDTRRQHHDITEMA